MGSNLPSFQTANLSDLEDNRLLLNEYTQILERFTTIERNYQYFFDLCSFACLLSFCFEQHQNLRSTKSQNSGQTKTIFFAGWSPRPSMQTHSFCHEINYIRNFHDSIVFMDSNIFWWVSQKGCLLIGNDFDIQIYLCAYAKCDNWPKK